MSVDVPKTAEETPVVKPVVDAQPEAVAPESTVAATESAAPEAPVEPATETIKTTEEKVIVEATPASEGTLGYKAPGFLKQFVFSKHFFWLGEEPATAESLKTYLSHEKPEIAHSHAAWAQETSQGVLYYTKRAEDKAHPLGLILLADASNVLKEGSNEFSFIVNKKHHRFEAATTAERDSWIVAVEKQIQESKAVKEEVTARDSYKTKIEALAAAPVVAAATKAERSTSKAPKKSLDASTATAAAAEPVPKEEAASISSSDKEKKTAKKERSQSRKRASVFGMFGKKDEDKELKKTEKAEKEVKKAEAEQVKTDKKAEAEAKKEEAKETHEVAPAVEAVEAAAVAAAPAAVVAAAENKKEEKHAKEAEADAVSPTDKKAKRSSVFGIFSKKVTSPTTEKSEKEATAPVETSEVPPVSETAPKLDEPIENKPIDAAAVTAPVDTVETPVVAPATDVAEPATETPAPVTEAPAAKSEKKGGFLSFIKKNDPRKEQKEVQKEIKKEEAEEIKAAEPVSVAAAPVVIADTTEPAVAADAEAPKDERATREKRRSSFFGSLGTIKKKSATPAEGSETEGAATSEVKREKSPLPAKIGGLFQRKSSKTVQPAETETPTAVETEAPKVEATEPATTAVTDSKVEAPVSTEAPTTVHDATTIAPSEVQTSA